jgi:hypothetical protein
VTPRPHDPPRVLLAVLDEGDERPGDAAPEERRVDPHAVEVEEVARPLVGDGAREGPSLEAAVERLAAAAEVFEGLVLVEGRQVAAADQLGLDPVCSLLEGEHGRGLRPWAMSILRMTTSAATLARPSPAGKGKPGAAPWVDPMGHTSPSTFASHPRGRTFRSRSMSEGGKT